MSRFESTIPHEYGRMLDVYKKFTIPKFQRPYSWEKQQLKDFFSSIVENDSPYFIGNIVCLPAHQNTEERLSVVDGQQRLTTISLFISAIINKYNSLKARSSDLEFQKIIEERITFCKSFLRSVDRSGRESFSYTVLELGRESYQSVYEKVINQYSFSESEYKLLDAHQKRIVDNYNELVTLISNQMSPTNDNDAYDYLYDIEQRITHLEFIVIILQNANEVFSIFEGMNSTGLDLSTSDLVKNAVLKRATSVSNTKKIESKWDELEELFIQYNPKDFPNFLRRWYMVNEGYVSNSRVFQEIKSKFIESTDYFSSLEEFLKSLIKSAEFYITVKRGRPLDDFIADRDLRECFGRFSLLNNDQVYTVLLAYYQFGVHERRVSIKKLKSYLNNLWNFVFRSMYISISPSDYERHFVNHAKTLSPKTTIEAQEAFSPEIFFKKLQNLTKDNTQFVENLADSFSYNSYDNRLIKNVLIDVMQSYSSFRDSGISIVKPEIEHILPQSPSKWGLSKSKVNSYVNKLGNLTVLFEGDNKEASDEIMEKKIEFVYSKSHFRFNKDIKNYLSLFTQNPEEAILSRGTDIAKQINKLYVIKL